MKNPPTGLSLSAGSAAEIWFAFELRAPANPRHRGTLRPLSCRSRGARRDHAAEYSTAAKRPLNRSENRVANRLRLRDEMTGQYGPDDLNELIGEARLQQVRGAAGTDRLIGQPWRINCRKNHHRNALGLRIGLQQPADFPTGDIRETQIQHDRVWLTCSCQADPVAAGIRGDHF